MIKKMTKYSFVIFHKEADAFLKSLQEIGVVDVTRQKRAIDSYSMEKFEEIAQYNAAAKALARIKDEAIAAKETIPAEKPQLENPVKTYQALTADIERTKSNLNALKDAFCNAEPWGVFTEQNISDIKALGFYNRKLEYIVESGELSQI